MFNKIKELIEYLKDNTLSKDEAIKVREKMVKDYKLFVDKKNTHDLFHQARLLVDDNVDKFSDSHQATRSIIGALEDAQTYYVRKYITKSHKDK